jgi:hypothetical protein
MSERGAAPADSLALYSLEALSELMSLTKAEVASYIENFLEGTGASWDWDDFISVRLSDPFLEEIRLLCAGLPELYPPAQKGAYCNDEGLQELRRILESLKGSDEEGKR